MASEEYKESDLSKIVKRLMDEEGFEFGEAVKEAMEQTKNFESKADGGSIGIEILFNDKMKNGGRVPAVSGGFLKLLAEGGKKGKQGIMELVESGKGKFDEFVETMNQSKKPSESFTSQNITTDLIDGPITVEKMANLDSKTLDIIKNTYDNGLYKEMPEILKAGNLLERFTKVVKGERIVDYERAESILGVPLKGDETLNEIFKIEFNTRPVEKLADGGRVGLFMGGDPLTGQALSIYDSMKAYNFSDQEIANALSAQGYYTPPGSTPDTPDTTPGQTIGFQGGNGGGGGITELDPLNTRTNISSGINRNDKTFIDPLNEKIMDQIRNEGMTIKGKNVPYSNRTYENQLNKYTDSEFIEANPDMFDIKTNKGFIGNTIDNFKTMGGSLIDKFSGSKVGQGATKFKNMAFTPMMALAQKRNPLNPAASNYNPNLQPQMDFLEGITGSRITGTSGNLKTTDGLAMIGRDPNSGLAKYGSGSVLSGQNVVSGFGTNDYETQLQNYIDKMLDRRTKGVLTEFQDAKLDTAYAELKAEQERAAAAAAKSAAEEIALAKSYNIGQRGGGAGDSSTSHMGGISQAQADAVGKANKEAGMSGWGLRDGGLATMFTRRR